MKTITISRKRTISINARTMESLRGLLRAREGHATFVATLGTNGNGGMLADISDIVEADNADNHLDDYDLTQVDYDELRQHVADAGGEVCDGDSWVAYDCHHTDSDGYLTGSISRIYVNLSV